MTYPDGRKLYTQYASGIDADISRVSNLADDDGASNTVGTHLEEYSYLGLSTVVSRAHPETGIDLTYLRQSSGLDGDGAGGTGDPVTGLDRFGRVIDQRWVDYNTTATAGDDVTTDRFQYGYDRNSNVLYKDNILNSASSELYAGTDDVERESIYDNLNRLQGFQRGALSNAGTHNAPLLDTVSSDTRSQTWSLDALGNWSSQTTDSNGSASGGSSTDTRTHNSRNEVTAALGGTPAYDANGNTTTLEDGKALTFDAWNHVITAAAPSGGAVQRTYAYDGLNRRISETLGTSGVKTDRYYSAGWQDIEARIGSVVKLQNVWSEVYIDALVLQDRDPGRSGGALDGSFDTDGKLTTEMGGTDSGNAVALQPDGKIVVAGTSDQGGSNDFAIVRYNVDGSLDGTFGTGGKVFVNYSIIDDESSYDVANAVAIDSQGRIVVAGTSDSDAMVVRLTPAGALDTSFSSDGKHKVNLGGSTDNAYAVAVDSSDRVVIAGTNGPDFALARLTTAGALDNTFDSDGKQTTEASGSSKTDVAQAMVIQPDGSIVIAGYSLTSNTLPLSYQWSVARYSTNGTLDTGSFGTSGIAHVDFSGSTQEIAYAIALQPDGKIVLGGYLSPSNPDFALARLTTAGALDTTFDSDGMVSTDTSGSTSTDYALAVKVAADGKIIAAGTATISGSSDFAMVRYDTNGSPDSTFGTSGKLTTNFGGTDLANALAITPEDGSIVAAGRTSGDFALARYSAGLQRYYVQQDANYNVTAVTDRAGVVIERYLYDPYGAVTVLNADWTADPDNTSDIGWNLLWQGARKEAYTGLYYFRNRDVSASLGRAIEPDPWTYVDGMSFYGWEGNSPAHQKDPFGLDYVETDPNGHVYFHDTAFGYETGVTYIGVLEDNGLVNVGKSAKGEDRYVTEGQVTRYAGEWCNDWDNFKESQSFSLRAAVYRTWVQVDGIRTGRIYQELVAANAGNRPPDPEVIDAADEATEAAAQLAQDGVFNYAGGAPAIAVAVGPIKATGQLHHAISAKVYYAIAKHKILKGTYVYRDARFVTRAADLSCHIGYQKWHRALDSEVVTWLVDNENATQSHFEQWLKWRYSQPDLVARFPKGLP